MHRWIIEPGTHTPRVVIDSEKSLLLIEGRSYPEEGMEFYDPILSKMREMGRSGEPIRHVHLRLEYYNSSTAKALADLFTVMRKIHESGVNVNVQWEYEEDDEGIRDDIDMFAATHPFPFEVSHTRFD